MGKTIRPAREGWGGAERSAEVCILNLVPTWHLVCCTYMLSQQILFPHID